MALLELKQLGKTNQLPEIELKVEKDNVLFCNAIIIQLKCYTALLLVKKKLQLATYCLKGKQLERKIILASVLFLKDEAYDRLKVKEYFKFLLGLYESKVSIEEVVQYVGLLDKLNVKIEKLSFSEKRRLHIGRIMIHHPDLVIWKSQSKM